jgi:hypothetical protein
MTPSASFRFIVIVSAVLLAAFTRAIPHPDNFAPITAMALFGAATLRDKKLALLTPLVALFVSDLCIEGMHRLGLMPRPGIYSGMWIQYSTILLITVMGFLLRRHRTLVPIAAATLAGSITFYIVTNFGYWALFDAYPHTFEGLLACYTAAIPFFRNALLGDATYCTVLFGAFALAERFVPALSEVPTYAEPQKVSA